MIKKTLTTALITFTFATSTFATDYFSEMQRLAQEKPHTNLDERRSELLPYHRISEKQPKEDILKQEPGFYDYPDGAAVVMPDMAILYDQNGTFRTYTLDGTLLGQGSYTEEELEKKLSHYRISPGG
ncbi:MAG: hypothetical protein ACQESG_04080 [Nanobdellota archaeon]